MSSFFLISFVPSVLEEGSVFVCTFGFLDVLFCFFVCLSLSFSFFLLFSIFVPKEMSSSCATCGENSTESVSLSPLTRNFSSFLFSFFLFFFCLFCVHRSEDCRTRSGGSGTSLSSRVLCVLQMSLQNRGLFSRTFRSSMAQKVCRGRSQTRALSHMQQGK